MLAKPTAAVSSSKHQNMKFANILLSKSYENIKIVNNRLKDAGADLPRTINGRMTLCFGKSEKTW